MLDFRNWLFLSERNYVDGKPFATSLEALRYIYDNHPRPDGLVVSLQRVDKLGINPKPTYNDTPLGIYFYTAEYVLNTRRLPYRGEEPYMFVCELTRPEKVVHIRKDGDEGSVLWFEAREIIMPRRGGRTADITKWNKYFRDLGIAGFIDHGTGTIYSSEPSQGVVFAASELRLLHKLENSGRRLRDLPKYDRMGDFVAGGDYITPCRKILRDIHDASDDAERDRILTDSRNTFWKWYKGRVGADARRDYGRLLRAVARYYKLLDGWDLSQLIINGVFGAAEIAKIFGAKRVADLLGKLDSNGVMTLLQYAPESLTANVIGSQTLNKLSDAAFVSLIDMHNFDLEEFALSMVKGGKRLSDGNVDALMDKAKDPARMAAIIGRDRATLRDDDERLESRP